MKMKRIPGRNLAGHILVLTFFLKSRARSHVHNGIIESHNFVSGGIFTQLHIVHQ